jgi:hypothetical protein
MLQLADVLANCIVEANETYAYCEGLARWADCCNTVILRIEDFSQFVALKANNENWAVPRAVSCTSLVS